MNRGEYVLEDHVNVTAHIMITDERISSLVQTNSTR